MNANCVSEHLTTSSLQICMYVQLEEVTDIFTLSIEKLFTTMN